MDAAVAAIRRHGAGVGMDELATAAGTSKTVVYRHFTDRADLHVAVCARVAEVLVEAIGAAMDAAGGARATTAAGIDAYLRLVEADPELYRFVVSPPIARRAEQAGPDPVSHLVSVIGERAAAVIAAQLAAAGRDPAAATPWGHGIVGMVHAAADHWLTQGGRDSGTAMTRDALAAHLTDLAWAGLSGVVVPTAPEEKA